MKNALLTGVALLITAASYAQNTTTITQSGTSQTATADQSGNTLISVISQSGTPANNTNNLGQSFQTGNGHTLTINQNNGSTFNRAGVTQGNLVSGTGSNSATISQSDGSGGSSFRGGDPATTAGDGNWTGIAQKGDGNKAQITQDGTSTTKNFAETYQEGTTNTATTGQSQATDGRAQIFQGNVNGSSIVNVTGNTADIIQDRSVRNDAVIKQLSNGNNATIEDRESNSSDNQAFINQGDGTNAAGQNGNTALIQQYSGTVSSNTATVEQTGTFSTGQVLQVNGSSNNVGYVKQVSGTGSYGRVMQSNGAQGNEGTVTQYGDFNNGYIFQQVNAISNKATIAQGNATSASDHLDAQIYQQVNTAGNVATITQQGSYDQAGLVQTGVGSNTATFGQTGNYNKIGGPVSPGPVPLVQGSALQDGTGNGMMVTQMSLGGSNTTIFNTARLSQTGTGNMLTVDQTANTVSNMATVTQSGGQNQAIVMQNGVSN